MDDLRAGSDWEQQKAHIIAEHAAMLAQLPISDEPFPDLEEANPVRPIHTRRDSHGNVYGYFPGCKSEGMLGWVADK